MFIKEINITGFRSYREITTVNNFSHKHNVVVGRNGSGKSNFFYAIQFVLSNEYNHLNQEQRNNILHEGTGNRSTLAKVEIVFDNNDRRIPSDSAEVRIMRQVGQKKDQYFIDNKVVTRTDVINLMESAGFSRSNPYYIVKQGKITELATAADSYRLQLIREVAGTRIFDEKKEESLKILRDTQSKIKKSETLLSFIGERLKKLEEEKEDLKEYQKWDKMKRSIEYTIYDAEIKEARSKCDKLAVQREQVNAQQNAVETKLISTKISLQNVESDLRKLEAQFKGKKEEQKTLLEEQTNSLKKKTQLELLIKDLKDDVDRERFGRLQAENDLKSLCEEIAEKEEQVQKLIPEYTRLLEEENQIITDIRIAEQKCKELSAKQGHQEQFQTIAQRDHHLKREIAFLDQQLAENLDQIKEIESSMNEDDNETINLQKNFRDLEFKVQESLSKIDSFSQKSSTVKAELEAAINDQMENARAEKQARESQSIINFEIVQAEQDLRRLNSKAITNGINSVNTILAQLKEKKTSGNKKLIDGYYGIVIDLFECESKYYKAIEVIAEGRLFYHVVEDDQIATTLLNFINEQDLHGEINFYPLNRVVPKPKRSVNDQEARPMLNEMKYDQKFDVVFRSIFANTVFVRNLVAGSRIAKSERFDCVTLEGDQVSRRGPMTGGFIDVKKSKLELAKKIRSLKESKVEYDEKIEHYSQITNSCISTVEQIRLSLNKIEMDRSILSHDHRLLTEKARNISEQLNRRLINKEPKKAQLLQLKSRIREMEARKQTFFEQLGTELNSQLTNAERELINKLQDEIEIKKTNLNNIIHERTIVENNKLSLENQLQSNLLRKRENLYAKIQDISVEEKRHLLAAEQAEVKVINDRLTKIMQLLSDLDESLIDYEKEKETLTVQLETLQDEKKKYNEDIDEFAKSAELFCTKISSVQAKREESLRKIRDIGTLPTDALGKYQNLTPKQLSKKMTECMNELKKYENVNKKALDQFVRASSQKDELTKRVDELKNNELAIKDLLQVLENRRYETLQLTFKQVAKNFHDVFKKLIPYGRADLVMKTSDITRDDGTGDTVEQRHIMERFIGIGIQVSFTGSSETREMSHLSGGQKTLVAIALIFAIQKCDPAPFYLFDEIDAALDPEHRKSVADMIHELSENAQFITTTFRSELLEHAEKFYGVRFRNKVSYIDVVTREQAYDFIQDDQTHS